MAHAKLYMLGGHVLAVDEETAKTVAIQLETGTPKAVHYTIRPGVKLTIAAAQCAAVEVDSTPGKYNA